MGNDEANSQLTPRYRLRMTRGKVSAVIRILLLVVEGPHAGQKFEFCERETFIVGRGPSAHFRLPQKDPFFSRTHFLIDVNPPLCRLIDLNSSNGTFVNGKRTRETNLFDGDLIQAGDTTFQVSIDAKSQQSKTMIVAGPLKERLNHLPKSGTAAVGIPVQSQPPLQAVHQPKRETVREPLVAALTGPKTPQLASQAQPKRDPGDVLRASTVLVADADRVASAPCGASQSDLNPKVTGQAPLNEGPPAIPGFAPLEQIGAGAMGVVYRTRRLSDGVLAAVKTIQPATVGSREDYDRFLREASILKSLAHPHIVRYFEQGTAGDVLYFVTEYVPGADARRLLLQQGPMAADRAINIICQTLEALQYAHECGYVHRDVKPANLLVDTSSGCDMVKLADFGLARIYHSSKLSGLTQLGTLGGTVPFMPPEQITDYRRVRPASDQYAAAATLYYLLTGKTLYEFPDDLASQLGMILSEEPVPIARRRSDLPPALCVAIHRALSRDTSGRYASCAEFRIALERATRSKLSRSTS